VTGVCYRTLGRVQEAEHQFKLALALNPAYHSAVFNLGLTYQHLSRWGEAIAHFRRVTEVSACVGRIMSCAAFASNC
jgi:tetratricopeptide (TPR) repeat protein